MFRKSSRSLRSAGALVSILALLPVHAGAQEKAPPPTAPGAPAATPGTPAATPAEAPDWPTDWPRDFQAENGTKFIVYEPQLDSWNGHELTARVAVAAKTAQDKDPTYGVVWLQAQTEVDKENRVVTIDDLAITKVKFPSAPDDAASFRTELEAKLHGAVETIALDRLEAQLKIMNAVQVTDSKPVKNDPPEIVFSQVPAILVSIDGDPAWRPVEGTDLKKVLNTQVLLLEDSSEYVYLHVFDGWMTADSLHAKWVVDNNPPPALATALAAAEKDGHVDLLEGSTGSSQGQGQDGKAQGAASSGGDGSKASPAPPSLSKTVPVIYVATTPTELIVTDGAPDYVPVEGTDLLYVKNTTGDVFKEIDSDKTYVLIAGRWFAAPSTRGPWQYVAGNDLPSDFSKIPDDSHKENVKASVPGTEQAQEALISNSVPQTAKIDTTKMKPVSPDYDGKPELAPIDGTSMKYVKNASLPVIQVDPGSYYMVNNGVWFTSSALNGPWSVATFVPTVIYTIPPSSPLHYVTYVYVYGAQTDTVYVGYTPGYYGTVVSNGVVVYGTGYTYSPWVGSVWYGPPVTYGYGACMTYSPWAGWAFAFGMGWAWGAATAGWAWGPYPHWGPYYYPHSAGAVWGPHGGGAVWGPGGWAGSTGNVYHRWGDTEAVTRSTGGYNAWTGNAWRGESGMSYNSRTGNVSAGQRGVAENAYTGEYAAGKRGATTTASGNTVVAGRGVTGNVDSNKTTETGYVRGSQGGVAKQGNDTYVGYGGNLYKKNSDGDWSQYNSDNGKWNDVSQSQVDQAQQQAKQQAQQRAQQAPQDRSGADSGSFDRGASQGSFGSGTSSNFDRSGGGFTRGDSASLGDDFNARSEGDSRTNGFRSAGGFGGFRGGAFGGGVRGGFGGGFRGGFRR